MATTQPTRNKNQVRQIAAYYLDREEIRNHVLIISGVNTVFRVSGLLRLAWDCVFDFEQDRVRTSITLVEMKTHKAKTIAVNHFGCESTNTPGFRGS